MCIRDRTHEYGRHYTKVLLFTDSASAISNFWENCGPRPEEPLPLVAIRQGTWRLHFLWNRGCQTGHGQHKVHPARRPLVVTLLSDRKAWLTLRDGNRLARTNKWRSARAWKRQAALAHF